MPDRYRVTLKRVKDGIVSNHFHDHLNVGDIVDVKAPAGQFCLDLTRQTPIVLIGGGVGITPVLSMLNAVAAISARREVWFFFGVRDGREHVFREHLQSLGLQNPSLHLHVCYSQPGEADRANPTPAFQHTERVGIDLLKRVLPSNQFEFYLCGPPAMMSDMAAGLKAWGVAEDKIFFVAFGAATVRKPELQHTGATTTAGFEIEFSRSGKKFPWEANADNLLDFAQRHVVTIDSGCRAGNCGTCLVALKSGEVAYLHEPGVTVEQGSCLTASPRPNPRWCWMLEGGAPWERRRPRRRVARLDFETRRRGRQRSQEEMCELRFYRDSSAVGIRRRRIFPVHCRWDRGIRSTCPS